MDLVVLGSGIAGLSAAIRATLHPDNRIQFAGTVRRFFDNLGQTIEIAGAELVAE